MEPNAVPEHLRESAQAVVDHLGTLRGGGLFLSGVDGVLLVDWLDSGIPVSLIVVALETVADRRRKRRVKSRLSLRSCKGEVKRLLKRGVPDRRAALSAGPILASPPPAAAVGDGLDGLAASATAQLDALPAGDPATVADLAMAIVRRFHEQAWLAASDEHPVLKAAAAVELADFQRSMDPLHWEEAVEEAARDLLRQRYPGLSAVAVWDRLHGS